MADVDRESSLLRYAILHTFGLVHAVLLTLVSFGLVCAFPSFSFWPLLSCLFLPALSACIAFGCALCVEYVCKGTTTIRDGIRRSWMPAVGVFLSSLFLLPLNAAAPLIVLHGIVSWLLQVYQGVLILSTPLKDS